MRFAQLLLCVVGMMGSRTIHTAAFSIPLKPLFPAPSCVAGCLGKGTAPRIPRHSSIAMQDGSDNQQILITKPRTSNAWFGIYFDVQARDKAVVIDAIKTGCSSMAEGETLDVQIWSCLDGSFIGKEEDKSAWQDCYKGKLELAHIYYDRFVSASEVDNYTELRFDTPVSLKPFETRGFLLHTGHVGGIILRGGFGPDGQKNPWKVGDVTDETVDIVLRSGLPCSVNPFQLVDCRSVAVGRRPLLIGWVERTARGIVVVTKRGGGQEEDSIARAFTGSILYSC